MATEYHEIPLGSSNPLVIPPCIIRQETNALSTITDLLQSRKLMADYCFGCSKSLVDDIYHNRAASLQSINRT